MLDDRLARRIIDRSDAVIANYSTGVLDKLGGTDTTKPDGAPRKLLDVSRLLALGWKPRVGFREGMRVAYEDFVAREAVAA